MPRDVSVQWQALGPSTWIGPGGLFEYIDATAPAFGQRFYRILVGVPPIVISSITVQPNGHVRLRHNGGDGGYTVQVSTNLVQWQVLGTSTLISPSLFEYVDTTAPTYGRCYYRIRSP